MPKSTSFGHLPFLSLMLGSWGVWPLVSRTLAYNDVGVKTALFSKVLRWVTAWLGTTKWPTCEKYLMRWSHTRVRIWSIGISVFFWRIFPVQNGIAVVTRSAETHCLELQFLSRPVTVSQTWLILEPTTCKSLSRVPSPHKSYRTIVGRTMSLEFYNNSIFMKENHIPTVNPAESMKPTIEPFWFI